MARAGRGGVQIKESIQEGPECRTAIYRVELKSKTRHELELIRIYAAGESEWADLGPIAAIITVFLGIICIESDSGS